MCYFIFSLFSNKFKIWLFIVVDFCSILVDLSANLLDVIFIYRMKFYVTFDLKKKGYFNYL